MFNPMRQGAFDRATLQDRPQPKRQPNERNEGSAQHLAVTLKRAETQPLQSNRGIDAEQDIGRDCARREHSRHGDHDPNSEFPGGEEGWNAFDHG